MVEVESIIKPIYFLIISIIFIFLSAYKFGKSGKSKETIYLSIISIFFLFCFFVLINLDIIEWYLMHWGT